jgi:hypothetical protein
MVVEIRDGNAARSVTIAGGARAAATALDRDQRRGRPFTRPPVGPGTSRLLVAERSKEVPPRSDPLRNPYNHGH